MANIRNVKISLRSYSEVRLTTKLRGITSVIPLFLHFFRFFLLVKKYKARAKINRFINISILSEKIQNQILNDRVVLNFTKEERKLDKYIKIRKKAERPHRNRNGHSCS
jgi:hypothetical protein